MNFWLWVAKEGGIDGLIDINSYCRWDGCDSDTEPGDYALIYKISPHSHIKYLVKIIKDSVLNINLLPEEIYYCEFKILYDFKKELTLDDMKAEQELYDWYPIKRNFQKKVFPIKEKHWKTIKDILISKNPDSKNSFE